MQTLILNNNSNQYFLDSNFVIALVDKEDIHHQKAVSLNEKISRGGVFFSDIVINEVLSVMAKRCESKGKKNQFKELAQKFQQALKSYPILCLYELLPNNYKRIFTLMTHHQGQLNFHDCLIAIFLKEVSDVHLVSFDKDFMEITGLKLISA